MATPPLYTHARDLYEAFEGEARVATPEECSDHQIPEGSILFVGHWSRTFIGREGLPGESTLQKAYAWLQERGCLEVLRQGARDYPGVVQLHGEPTPEDAATLKGNERYSRSGRLGAVEVSVEGLVKRVNDLEDEIKALNGQFDALVRDIELQLRRLQNPA